MVKWTLLENVEAIYLYMHMYHHISCVKRQLLVVSHFLPTKIFTLEKSVQYYDYKLQDIIRWHVLDDIESRHLFQRKVNFT